MINKSVKKKLFKTFAVVLSTLVISSNVVINAFAVDTATTYSNVNFKSVFDFTNSGKQESNPSGLMAHNIYSNPVLDNTTKKFDGFMIDFKADYAGQCTYWALCNWHMNLSDLKSKYKNVAGGGAYCGLQTRQDGTKAIMSFWETTYDGKKVEAALVYPKKDGEGHFNNEGSGSNYIVGYDWKPGKWYRMYINCYDDANTGNTFVEMWVMDIETAKWDKICCYDTKLKNSYFEGEMSQFMENFDGNYSSDARSFQYANINLREYKSKKWTPITSSVLSIDTWWGNKKGTYAFGSTTTNLWGATLGYGKDAAALNADIHSVERIIPTYKAVTPAQTQPNPFADVKTESWQYQCAKYAVDFGLMSGKGNTKEGKIKFDPDSSMTRAEFVQVLYNSEKKPAVKFQKTFKDVKESDWFGSAVIWAYQNQITVGKGENFDVYGKITREEMATMLKKYAAYKKLDVKKSTDISSYKDAQNISSWAVANMKWAVAHNIMKGKGTTLDPKGNASRAECAAMLMNFYLEFDL